MKLASDRDGSTPFCFIPHKENFRFSKHSFQITDVEWKYRLNAG